MVHHFPSTPPRYSFRNSTIQASIESKKRGGFKLVNVDGVVVRNNQDRFCVQNAIFNLRHPRMTHSLHTLRNLDKLTPPHRPNSLSNKLLDTNYNEMHRALVNIRFSFKNVSTEFCKQLGGNELAVLKADPSRFLVINVRILWPGFPNSEKHSLACHNNTRSRHSHKQGRQ